jgi:hypothetical protein
MADVLNGGPARPVAEQSTGELVQLASEQISRLVRDEIALAKAELTEKGKHAGIGIGLFSGSGVFAPWSRRLSSCSICSCRCGWPR